MIIITFIVITMVERITVTQHPTNVMMIMMTRVRAVIILTTLDNILLLIMTMMLLSTDVLTMTT